MLHPWKHSRSGLTGPYLSGGFDWITIKCPIQPNSSMIFFSFSSSSLHPGQSGFFHNIYRDLSLEWWNTIWFEDICNELQENLIFIWEHSFEERMNFKKNPSIGKLNAIQMQLSTLNWVDMTYLIFNLKKPLINVKSVSSKMYQILKTWMVIGCKKTILRLENTELYCY